jgi:hypothetical protein
MDGDRGALFIDASNDHQIARYAATGHVHALQYIGGKKLLVSMGSKAYGFSTDRVEDGVLSSPIDFGATIMARSLAPVSADMRIVMPTGIYNAISGAHELTVPFIENELIHATMSGDESIVMTANASELVAYRTKDGSVVRQIALPHPSKLAYLQVMGVVLTHDGRTAIFATSDGNIFTVDLTSDGGPVHLGKAKGVRQLHIDPSSKRLLVSSGRPDSLWDLESGEKLLDLPFLSVEARLSPDGRYIVRRQTAGLEVRDARDGSLVHELPSFDSAMTSMSITRDLILTTSLPGEVHIWRLDSGAIVYRQGHGHDVRVGALSDDGSEYAIASRDHVFVYPIPRSDDSTEMLVNRLRSVFDSRVFRLRYVLDKPTAPASAR